MYVKLPLFQAVYLNFNAHSFTVLLIKHAYFHYLCLVYLSYNTYMWVHNCYLGLVTNEKIYHIIKLIPKIILFQLLVLLLDLNSQICPGKNFHINTDICLLHPYL